MKNLRKVCSLAMLLVLLIQVSGPTVYIASEISSELASNSQMGATLDSVSEENSELPNDSENLAVEDTKSTENSKLAVNSEIQSDTELMNEVSSTDLVGNEVLTEEPSNRAYTDFSGIGNQNSSAIGQATYIAPNEETEASLKTISDLNLTDSSKYRMVTDLDTNLIDVAIKDTDITEGIMLKQYPEGTTTAQINADIASRLDFRGTCWQDDTANRKNIGTNIVESDECDLVIKDYGYKYNLMLGTLEPVDLTVSVDYLDFFNSPSDDTSALFGLGASVNGIDFNTWKIDELQITFDFRLKDGTQVNVPTFYELGDVDAASSLGIKKDDLYGITTYYQDESYPASGDYEEPLFNGSLIYTHEPIFNYQPFFDYVTYYHDRGDISDTQFNTGTAYRGNDRSIYNSIDASIDGNGTYEPEDRGWNRLKFYETDDYITFFDSWGANSNGVGSTNDIYRLYSMITNGKESKIVVELNTSTTLTSNLETTFLGFAPDERALSQTFSMKPYSFVGEPVMNKSTTDASGDGIAQRGEQLTYDISVQNLSAIGSLDNVPVRDSLLENLPDYLRWVDSDSDGNGDIKVTDLTNGTAITYTGDLSDGTFQLDSIPPLTSVQIEYEIEVIDIPEDVNSINNVATDTGENPDGLCDSTTSTLSCDGTETPVEETGNPTIEKTAVDAGEDGVLSPGEVINYTVKVTNNTGFPAYTIDIKDSMLNDTPDWLTFNDDEMIVTDPTDIIYSGSLATDDLLVDTLQPGDSITITYSLTADNPIPDDVAELINVATDNGDDPTIIDPETCNPVVVNDDCAGTITPVRPDKPIIDPTEAKTVITKSVTEASGDNLIQGGEQLTYTIEVTNNETVDANNVVVRDSMLESMPPWLTLNEITIDPSDIAYTGSLQTGDLTFNTIEPGQTVTITYSVTASQPLPADISEVANIATDNGQDPTTIDPETCNPVVVNDDCAGTITPLDPQEPIIDPTQAETIITKSVTEASGDNLIQGGEELTYIIEVTNNQTVNANNVVVRDSMLEAMPSWLTLNEITIDPSDIAYTGSLQTGDLTFNTIESGQTVTITYSVTASQPLPTDITEVGNLATDNGQDPTTVDPDTCDGITIGPITIGSGSDDCAITVTPLDPQEPIIDPTQAETVITKSVTEASGDSLVQGGEQLTYTIEVTNNETVDANNVVVRDSMLESMPSWLTLNEITIDPSDIAYTGSLQTGDLTFNTIEPGQTVTITYSVTASQPLPADVSEVANIATDNGQNPTTIDPETCNPVVVNDDCAGTITPLDPQEPIIDPTQAETEITKSVTDASGDNQVQGGEELTYTIEVTNNQTVNANNVVVRDSMLEAMPSWLTLNEITIDPSDIAYTGSLQTGDLTFNTIEPGQTVTITYSVTASQPLPTDITEVGNLATDNGQDPTTVDPDTCDGITIGPITIGSGSDDCAITVTPLDPQEPIIDPTQAETVIKKSVSEASGDGLVQGGEQLTYTIEVTNNQTVNANNVVVRDSMLEAMPSWLTLNEITIDPSDIAYTGSLQTGDLTFNTIEPGQTVTITYSVTASQPLPADITEVANLATDNGQDPTTIDPETCNPVVVNDDCAGTITPLDPQEPIIDPTEAETEITKSVTDASGDGLVQGGEQLTYTIVITNQSDVDAYNVVVRDSMLESMPSWLTLNDITIDPSDIAYTGSLEAGDLTFNTIEAGQSVTITYSVTASQPLPADISEVANIATDNGEDPTTIDPETCNPVVVNDDCAGTITPLDPQEPIIDPTEAETVITKSVTDASGDNLVQGGEQLTYTIEVTNNETIDANNVVVRDSMLEAIPSWLTLDQITIDPSDIAYDGSLEAGNLTFYTIEPGQTVTITYSVTASQPLPTDITEVGNLVTDNGQDPTIVDPDTCDGITIGPITIGSGSDDCAITITPLDPQEPIIDPTEAETVITKSVTDESGDNLIQGGEQLTYTIEVANNSLIDANNVVVRDSMLESMPSWLTLNEITIDPSDIDYTGSLEAGNLTFTTIKAGQTVTITYSVTASQPLPADITEVTNLVTDNGQDPTTIDPETCNPVVVNDDCAGTITPLDPQEPIIDPTQAETVITKSVTDASGDGLVQGGEQLTYTIGITNSETVNANNVVVRDSMLENKPEWLTLDEVTIDPSDITYDGSLEAGNLTFNTIEAGQTVTITYKVTASQPLPADISEVVNIATDNGQDPSIIDPETCNPVVDNDDCTGTITPLDPQEPIIDPTQAETEITKSVTDASGDNLVQGGEQLTYTIEVVNNNPIDANNVVVRDSMLEAMPSWLTLNQITIDPSDIAYTGSLEAGNLTFNTIEPGQTVTITYSVTASQPLPADISDVANVATDNGSDPVDPDTNLPIVCTEDSDDCAITVTPLDPQEPIIDPTEAETVITKSVTDASGDNLVQGGEQLTYTIEVVNNETIDANNVVVRDSMLESMPSWLMLDEVSINPSDIAYTGSLEAGNLTFNTIEAGQTVTITYKVTASQPLPADISEVVNIATDNGQDPSIIDPETCNPVVDNDDCTGTITPLDPQEPIIDPTEAETVITKSVTDASGDNLVEGGEQLTYTIEVVNNETIDANNVVVRDSMLEAMPSWLTLDQITIDPSDIAYTGSLEAGNLTFNTIEAGQTVTIVYSVIVADEIPSDISEIINIATDNGQDPSVIEPETCEQNKDQCATTTNQIKPEQPVVNKDKDDLTQMELAKTGAKTMLLFINFVGIILISLVLKIRLKI